MLAKTAGRNPQRPFDPLFLAHAACPALVPTVSGPRSNTAQLGAAGLKKNLIGWTPPRVPSGLTKPLQAGCDMCGGLWCTFGSSPEGDTNYFLKCGTGSPLHHVAAHPGLPPGPVLGSASGWSCCSLRGNHTHRGYNPEKHICTVMNTKIYIEKRCQRMSLFPSPGEMPPGRSPIPVSVPVSGRNLQANFMQGTHIQCVVFLKRPSRSSHGSVSPF